MSVKFQFQFAGADFSRPSSPHRKWLRIGLTSLAVVLAGLAYWQYIHHLTHRSLKAAPVAAKVVATESAKVVPPAAAVAAVAAAPVATLPSSLKKVANDSVAVVGSYLLQTVKAVPVATPSTVPPAAQPMPTETVAAPVVVTPPVAIAASRPVTPRQYRVHTDAERLIMAGQIVFENVMDMANKYPDAYGFQAGDFLSDAKLGAPMPVYTIEESARASYQSGQPIKPLLKAAKQWVFPVLMGERIGCMVEVKQIGHEYVPGKGNKSLGMAWQKIQEKWSTEDGYHPMLVVNPDVPGYYFTVPELPTQNLTDTIEMFYFHPGTSPADVILASWR